MADVHKLHSSQPLAVLANKLKEPNVTVLIITGVLSKVPRTEEDDAFKGLLITR